GGHTHTNSPKLVVVVFVHREVTRAFKLSAMFYHFLVNNVPNRGVDKAVVNRSHVRRKRHRRHRGSHDVLSLSTEVSLQGLLKAAHHLEPLQKGERSGDLAGASAGRQFLAARGRRES